jgi:hypothetical protein
MKRHHIRQLESIIDDGDLSELEVEGVRDIIRHIHLIENSCKADARKMTILRLNYPATYSEVLDMYDDKYGRPYKGDEDEPA